MRNLKCLACGRVHKTASHKWVEDHDPEFRIAKGAAAQELVRKYIRCHCNSVKFEFTDEIATTTQRLACSPSWEYKEDEMGKEP